MSSDSIVAGEVFGQDTDQIAITLSTDHLEPGQATVDEPTVIARYPALA